MLVARLAVPEAVVGCGGIAGASSVASWRVCRVA